ncbi:MAG: hypothetical protein Q9159_005341 [Coniocarpon cinnabarinum]
MCYIARCDRCGGEVREKSIYHEPMCPPGMRFDVSYTHIGCLQEQRAAEGESFDWNVLTDPFGWVPGAKPRESGLPDSSQQSTEDRGTGNTRSSGGGYLSRGSTGGQFETFSRYAGDSVFKDRSVPAGSRFMRPESESSGAVVGKEDAFNADPTSNLDLKQLTVPQAGIRNLEANRRLESERTQRLESEKTQPVGQWGFRPDGEPYKTTPASRKRKNRIFLEEYDRKHPEGLEARQQRRAEKAAAGAGAPHKTSEHDRQRNAKSKREQYDKKHPEGLEERQRRRAEKEAAEKRSGVEFVSSTYPQSRPRSRSSRRRPAEDPPRGRSQSRSRTFHQETRSRSHSRPRSRSQQSQPAQEQRGRSASRHRRSDSNTRMAYSRGSSPSSYPAHSDTGFFGGHGGSSDGESYRNVSYYSTAGPRGGNGRDDRGGNERGRRDDHRSRR